MTQFDQLEAFALLCNDTRRASFSITKNVKTRKWKVRVGNRKCFIDDSLSMALHEASKYIYNQREFVGSVPQISYS